MSEPQKKFYLTTPIYYVNARPHIGHAYTTIAADVIARRHRLLGPPVGEDGLPDTFLLTGTDEHGQKIERSAAAAGIPPQQFADQVSASFRTLWDRMGITYNDYIRTTEPRHKVGAQKLFTELYNRGHIYLSTYTGAYCVSDETFVDAPVGTACPDCGRILEEVTEENFFFRLSAFQAQLIDLIESEEEDAPLRIQPDVRKNEVVSFLRGNVLSAIYEDEPKDDKGGLVSEIEQEAINAGKVRRSEKGTLYVPGALKDLSISRSSFKWGIPVPAEVQQKAGATQPHIIYVWLDALVNYMSAVGYGSDDPAKQEQFKKYWPANLHLVGKEIIRFHCVYWPAFLIAAELPLPKAITAHGWLLFEDSKMSKSRGNIVRTETILDAFGTLCPPKPQSQTASPSQPLSSTQQLSSFAEGGGPAVALKGTGFSPSVDTTPSDAALAAEGIPTPPTKSEQDLFASDVLRYFLLREIPFGQDGSFSFDALVQRYNSDLANGYGNLVSRTLNMVNQFCGGNIPFGKMDTTTGLALNFLNYETSYALDQGNYNFSKFLENANSDIARIDGYLSEKTPWKLAKLPDEASRKELENVLCSAINGVRLITIMLYPVIPFTTSKVWDFLGLGDITKADGANLVWISETLNLDPSLAVPVIFPRIEKKEISKFIQIMTDMESPTTSAPATTESVQSVPSVLSLSPEPAPATETTPQITIDDFVKIDLRVAKITVAERIPKADKLLRLEVDLGYETRQILSGIAEWYTPEELIGRKIVIIANLAPRKMRGLESHGMLLAASHGPEEGGQPGKPILATFTEDIALGSRLK